MAKPHIIYQPVIIYHPDLRRRMTRPLFASRISAGFPSPADDYIERRIDLNRDLTQHPIATFYIRVQGDSMIDAGINEGDFVVVDRAAETCDGHIVVALVCGEMTIKRLCIEPDGGVCLSPANDNYEAIRITEDMEFEVWGRVLWSFKSH